jgi:hypothetical protein
MKLKTLTPIILLGLSLSSFGCAGEETARQMALQLRASIIEDEQLIDKTIETQTTYYENQRKTIDKYRGENITFELEAQRRKRSAEAASAMSSNPQQEARLINLMNYLQETNDQEYELWKKLYGGEQEAREELKSKIAKLQRQKRVLTQVKDNLNQLALASNRKKRARMLIQFSQETIAALKASK